MASTLQSEPLAKDTVDLCRKKKKKFISSNHEVVKLEKISESGTLVRKRKVRKSKLHTKGILFQAERANRTSLGEEGKNISE